MAILIRPVRIDDAQGMIDVLNPIVRAGGTTAIEVKYSLEAQHDFVRAIGPHSACFVAVDEPTGGIVGFQGYERYPALPDHT